MIIQFDKCLKFHFSCTWYIFLRCDVFCTLQLRPVSALMEIAIAHRSIAKIALLKSVKTLT